MVEPKKNIKNLFRTRPEFESRIGKIERLDRNERIAPFPEDHLEAILSAILPEELVAYPELEPLYKKLAGWLGVERDEVLLTHGSDTAIRAVYEVFVEDGDEVLMMPPTYGMFSVYCAMYGGVKKEVFYNDDFSMPVERILDAINPKTKLVVIANPNHTGTVIEESGLVSVIEKAAENEAVVMVDEAYHFFYEGTMLPYINRFDNLIVIRTFSKAFGIPPLRIGYLISNKENIAQLYKVKLTYEITVISAKFGEYLLDHQEIMEDHVNDVNEGKAYLQKAFSTLGIIAHESHTNFIFAMLPENVDGKKVVDALKEKNIYINGPYSVIPVKNCIRITVGSKKKMEHFFKVFESIIVPFSKNKIMHDVE